MPYPSLSLSTVQLVANSSGKSIAGTLCRRSTFAATLHCTTKAFQHVRWAPCDVHRTHASVSSSMASGRFRSESQKPSPRNHSTPHVQCSASITTGTVKQPGNGPNVAEPIAPSSSSSSLYEPLSLVESPFSAVYESAVANGTLKRDPAQFAAACVLSRVSADMESHIVSEPIAAAAPSWLSRLVPSLRPGIVAPKGAYIWSTMPGCGKTMLTDMMFDAVDGERKRREHFHTFALEVHARLHEQRHDSNSPSDKLGNVARALASEFRLLVVDEFQVTDISDAVIAHHLFKKLFANGVVLVATSNRAPEQLYENGLQRELFEPLIPLLRERLEVHEMGATVDYRLRHKDAISSTYFLDADGGRASALAKFKELVSGFPIESTRLPVLGRTLILPAAVPKKRVALCKFEDICERPLSSADYRALVAEYHTIVLIDVPVLDVVMDRNALRRMTNFVDLAYEARVKLILHADAPPALLVRGAEDGRRARTEEAFAAGRLVSRLIEMQTSDEYLSSSWRPSTRPT